MSIGKYISLKEAREKDKLERFMKEHWTRGDKELLEDTLESMIKSSESDNQTSSQDDDED